MSVCKYPHFFLLKMVKATPKVASSAPVDKRAAGLLKYRQAQAEKKVKRMERMKTMQQKKKGGEVKKSVAEPPKVQSKPTPMAKEAPKAGCKGCKK